MSDFVVEFDAYSNGLLGHSGKTGGSSLLTGWVGFDAIDALRRASGCELGESGLKQGDGGGVVPFLGGVEGSVAIVRPSRSKSDTGIRSRCEKSTNDIDVA